MQSHRDMQRGLAPEGPPWHSLVKRKLPGLRHSAVQLVVVREGPLLRGAELERSKQIDSIKVVHETAL